MAYTGEDYAKEQKTDMTTAVGMRVAMFGSVKAWRGLPEEQKTADKARELLNEAVRSNDLLQAAGTQELVQGYFGGIANKASDENLKNFINALSEEDIEGIEQGKTKAVLSAAGAFSSASRKYLGMGTVTDGFQGYLKEKATQLKNVQITPHALTGQQIETVEAYENKFRSADEMDDTLYEMVKDQPVILEFLQSLGVAFPAVAQKLTLFDPEKEQALNTAIEAAARLKAGNSEDAAKDAQAIQNAVGFGGDISKLTLEQYRALGTKLLDSVAHIRSAENMNVIQQEFEQTIRESGSPVVDTSGWDKATGEALLALNKPTSSAVPIFNLANPTTGNQRTV